LQHPSGEGYLVFFAWHGGGRSTFGTEVYKHLMFVHARKMVCVGAGALATTEIMLRSEANGFSVSPHVGKGISGNGDILASGYVLSGVAAQVLLTLRKAIISPTRLTVLPARFLHWEMSQ
jgi:hypothetical protein